LALPLVVLVAQCLGEERALRSPMRVAEPLWVAKVGAAMQAVPSLASSEEAEVLTQPKCNTAMSVLELENLIT